VCRAEAAGVEQFARQNEDTLTVVGLGTQDSLEEAEAFVADHGLTIRMLWDGTYQSWAELGVSLQPSAMLLSPDGQLLEKWLGPIPEDEVVALAAGEQVPAAASGGQGNFCRYADRYVSAHAAIEDYGAAPPERRQRVIDDIRFAANAMAQTAPAGLAEGSEALAAANRELAAIVVEAGLEPDRIDAAAWAAAAADRDAALDSLHDPVQDACAVGLPR